MEGAAKRAFTLLEIVSRETTNENEAISAARQLGRMKDAAGGFDKLFGTTPPPTIRLPIQSFNESRRTASRIEQERDEAVARVAELEAQVSRLTVDRTSLKQEIIALKNAMKTRIEKRADGTMPFKEFAHKAETILGIQGWRQEFVRQTGIDKNAFNRAANVNLAGPELVELLPTLKSAKKAAFTPSEVASIREWAAELDNDDLAEMATDEFGRIITVSSIRKLKTNLTNGNGPYSDPAYGGPIRAPKAAQAGNTSFKNASFPWARFPELEMLVCENQLKPKRIPASEIARIVSKKSGIRVNLGTINQRTANAPPPEAMTKDITGVGPLTWPELWMLGTKFSKRGWKENVFQILNETSRRGGQPLDDIPQEKVEMLRRKARELDNRK